MEIAVKVLEGLARLGVREFCIAAGARNAPLLGPLLASSGVKVFHFFDERSAAFFALGRSMVSLQPVAVITTSGTAAAELLPAVMEAYYQGAPLVLVTADRPRSYRGSGAPQAVEQVGLYGPYTTPTLDIDKSDAVIEWPRRLGLLPFHLNVCLDEPEDHAHRGIAFGSVISASTDERSSEGSGRSILESWLEQREGLVVLVGGLHPMRVAQVSAFLRAVNAPVLAEATANLDGRSELEGLLLRGGEKRLRELPIRRVLRIGAVPTWRWWRDLESRPEIAVLNIGEPSFSGLARKENVESTGWKVLELKTEHCAGAISVARLSDLPSALDHQLGVFPLSEIAWLRALSEAIPAGAYVFLGNSLPIREWNLAARPPKPEVVFFANRGANGIDGQVSTFLGVGADAGESWLVCGDLTALYDLSAPWVLPQLAAGMRRIVVINNHGGRIFSRMDAFRSMGEAGRQSVENSHTLIFEPWAAMWGLHYRLCQSPSDLENLPGGSVLIEIRPDEHQSQAFWDAWDA